MQYSDLVNRRHQFVTLSSTRSSTTVSFRNSHNIPNSARYRKDCRLESYSQWHMYSPVLGTGRTWSSPTIALQATWHCVQTSSIKICNLNIYNSQYVWLELEDRTKIYKMMYTISVCSAYCAPFSTELTNI